MEEEQPARASSASSSHNADSSFAAASSSRASEANADADAHTYTYAYEDQALMLHVDTPELQRQQISVTYRGGPGVDEDGAAITRDDTWSCIVVVLTFWFFVSMTLILGVYGSVSTRLGPNSSILLQPNPLFVQYLKVEELGELTTPGPMLFGLNKAPPLDVITTWDQKLKAYMAAYSHREWVYYLNRGSQVNITYSVSSLSSTLILVIAQGNEGLSQWIEDPTYPNITLSWQLVHGNGTIQQNIYTSSSYYVAVGNTNLEEVEVQLNLRVKAFQYNTMGAYSKCNLAQGQCSLRLLFPKGNAAVVTSPGPEQDIPNNEWYVKLSYGPRWLTYIVGVGGMTLLMIVVFKCLSKFQFSPQVIIQVPFGGAQPETAPLLSHKDDDLYSWDSSYESHDEEDTEDKPGGGGLDAKPKSGGENNINPKRLCTVCSDAPRDCFFLPCGHCVACFTCGTRILEKDGPCPICRRTMKEVRKVLTV